jgi:UDP:flavonoid glycosyltransferase YjiC (YdhE family)
MSRFLFTTWDGAGNLVPTLALARRLALAGHDVRVLGQASINRRCGQHGWRFRSFHRTIDVDSLGTDTGAGMPRLAQELWLGRSVAEDVIEELQREAADVLIADCMLFGAMSAGQAARLPTIALFHAAFALFRGGPLAGLLSTQLPQLNALRVELGLPVVEHLCAVHDACAMSVVAAPREFDPPVPLPATCGSPVRSSTRRRSP